MTDDKSYELKLKELAALIYFAEREYEISRNENLDEETTDAAYAKHWDYLRKIAAMLIDIINVDEKTALRMAAFKGPEIMALLKKAAV